MSKIPEFANKDLLFKHLRDSKNLLLTEKKSTIKHADMFSCETKEDNVEVEIGITDITDKAVTTVDLLSLPKITVKVVINTTNLMDSHDDVHIPNLWNKSLKEQRNLHLLKEHVMSFENVISDNVQASAKTYSWTDLGYNLKGNTQALIFKADVEKERNEMMFNYYAKGYVKNHSVGMRYVKIEMAMNSTHPSDISEKQVWDKYINQIANAELAEQKGYFFAVTEAKIVEGSAVPMGSNYATPTISVGKQTGQLSNNIEALDNPADDITGKDEPQTEEAKAEQLRKERKMNYLINLNQK